MQAFLVIIMIIFLVGIAIYLRSLIIFPYVFILNLSFSMFSNVIFAVIYATIIYATLLYISYKSLNLIWHRIRDKNNSDQRWQELSKMKIAQKKIQQRSTNHRLVTAVEKLPTPESIQKLVSEDGEIPDEAFQNQQNSGN